MKIKGLKISIFMLILSICACGFISWNYQTADVYAATNATAYCYYLLGDDGEAYQANVSVGSIEGLGDFVVGEQNIQLTATANDNYQLVGWQVTYNEQSNKTEFFDTSELIDNSKTIMLTTKDTTDDGENNPEEIEATLTFAAVGGYFTSGSFTLSKVFEDVTINPVFDHIYYQVVINDLVAISNFDNFIVIGDNTLYYETAVENDEVTEYENAYIKIAGNYYYYGSVFAESGKYYTIHQTLTDTPADEKVDYSKGAYRLEDVANISFDVDISADDILSSKNIDITGFTVSANRIYNLDEYRQTSTSNYYAIQKDSFLRTSSYNINFIVATSSNYTNIVNLSYHDLYVVDINLLVDGSRDHEEDAEILGNLQVSTTEIKSNLSIYNFYSIVDLDSLSFLVKTASNNNSRSFGLNSVERITATTGNGTFTYYLFDSINGTNNKSVYYSSITQNLVVNVNYSSVEYDIDFGVAEYMVDSNLNPILVEMGVDVPDSLSLKRGETLLSGSTAPDSSLGEIGDYYFDTSSTLVYEKQTLGWVEFADHEAMEIIGYEFVGFASALTSSVDTDFEYTVSNVEPVGTKVWLCFKKIEHEIVVANYNQISIETTTALSSLTFTKTNAAGQTSQTLFASELTGTSVTLSNLKFKLGESLSITQQINNGFDVKYSLLSPAEMIALLDSGKSEEEMTQFYLTELEFTESFIANYATNSQVTIYVYEEKIEYTLTYFINVETEGSNKYLMANIDVIDTDEEETNDNFSIIKYDLEGVEIIAGNNNLDAEISKIVISGLYLKDSITLVSVGKPFDKDSYVFNWFIDGRTTLSSVQDEDSYNHEEIISRTRTIQVVYSIPVAQVYINLDEDFARTEEFTYSYEIKVDGNVISPIDANLDPNLYSILVGKVVTITVGGLGYGYSFIGYQANSGAIAKVDGYSFDYTTILGANEITLKFERTIFQFYFAQYGAVVDGKELNGEYVDFDGKNYIELTVDKTTVDVNKPIGYYVKSLEIEGFEINANVENNADYRSYANIPVYKFILARTDFISTVSNFGVDTTHDGILEIYIQLEYEIYMYDVVITHTDPQGAIHSSNVQYLKTQLNYSLNGQDVVVDYAYASNRVTFEKAVPYGADTVVRVLGSLQTGLRFVGWAYTDTNLVTYSNGAKYLNLGNVVENKEFLYMFTYEAHELRIEYDNLQGSPYVEINNISVSPLKATINLFDTIKLNANAIRANGYKFKSFSFNKAVYTPYNYDDATWNEVWFDLYVLDGYAYVKNESNEYVSTLNYYVYSTELETLSEGEEIQIDKFIISDFEVKNKCITFNVEYELLQLEIINGTLETNDGTITGSAIDTIVHFDINELLNFTITATDKSDVTRDIGATDTVTFNDVVRIKVEINKMATEYVSGNKYDLSLGVELYTVQISGVIANVIRGGVGEYWVEFGVDEYMPDVGEEINIIYTVRIQQKNVFVTTAVSESDSFYENVHMYTSSESAFGGTFNSLGNPQLDKNWQFMAPITAYTLMTHEYLELFKTSGVKIYLTEYDATTGLYVISGEEINPAVYDQYGISLVMTERNVAGVGRIKECQVAISNLTNNYHIIFQVQPIITYNGGPRFEKVFDCDNSGNARAQLLTIGASDEFDIQLAEEIKGSVQVKYQLLSNGVLSGTELDEVLNVGEYKVLISFSTTGDYDWLSGVSVTENVTLVIKPKNIALTYDSEAVASNRVEKIYNKSSVYNVDNIFKYLILTDGNDMNILYESLLSVGSSNLKLDTNIASYISSGGKDEQIAQANESVYYNLYVYNIALQNSTFNNNFNLLTKDLIITNYIKIKKLVVDLEGLSVYSKVYDGTDKAELNSTKEIKLSKIYAGDDVIISVEKLVVKFEDYSVGENKSVIIDASTALGGYDASNYAVNNARIRGLTIYPYSVSTNIKGIGEIKLFNERGLTDSDFIALIPLNATLVVEPIIADSVQYSHIYGKISQYLKGNNEFSVGYSLSLMVNGQKQEIDNNLYLSIPNVKNITGAYFLTDSKTDDIKYKVSNGKIVIDLNQTDLDVDSLFMTQKRILLKPWQIVLIVTTAVALVSAGVLTFIILRKRKHKVYSVHDKI